MGRTLAPWALALSLLSIALGVRLWQIDLTRFSDDDVGLFQAASAFLDTGQVPLSSGESFSINVNEPPLITFLLAAMMAVSRSPLWVAGCVAALSALGAVFVALAAEDIAGSQLAGAAAGLLYALNPAAIVYGRMIPNTGFSSVLVALALFGLVDFWRHRRPASFAISCCAIAWAAQLHAAIILVLAFWPVVAAFRWRSLSWRLMSFAGIIATLPLAPYLYLQVHSNWADVTGLIHSGGASAAWQSSGFYEAGLLAGPAILRHPFFNPEPSGGYDPMTWLLISIAALGSIAALRPSKVGGAIVVAWVVVPVAIVAHHSGDLAPHYLLAIVPALAVLEGLALSIIPEALRRLGVPTRHWRLRRLPCLGLVALLGLWQLVSYSRFLQRVSSDPRHADYVIPLRYSLRAAALLPSDSGSDTVYLSAPFHEGFVVRYLAGHPHPWLFVNPSIAILPASSSWYLTQHDTLAQRLLPAISAPVASVATSTSEPAFELFRLPPNAAERIAQAPDLVRIESDVGNSLRLVGYRPLSLRAGHSSATQWVWKVTDAAALKSMSLSQFVHLTDGAGKVWSSSADLYDLVEPWSTGDVVVTELDLNVRGEAPTGGYWLETGFYQTFSQQPLTTSRGTSVRVGPLRVGGVAATPDPSPPLATFGSEELELMHVQWAGESVNLDWRAQATPRTSYTVFVHALDDGGRVVAQHDGLPVGGSYPTSLWKPGDVVHDVHPVGLLPGPGLRLEIGMYTRPDLGRVPVRRRGIQGSGDHLLIDAP